MLEVREIPPRGAAPFPTAANVDDTTISLAFSSLSASLSSFSVAIPNTVATFSTTEISASGRVPLKERPVPT